MTTRTFLDLPVRGRANVDEANDEAVKELADYETSTVSGKAQRWEVDFVIRDNLGTARLGAKFMSHYTKHRRRLAFDWPMPQYPAQDDITEGTVTVRVAAEADATQIRVKTASGRVMVPDGYYISFAGHRKVYIIQADATLSTVAGTFQIYPSLRASVRLNEVVSLTPIGRWKYGPNMSSVPIINGLTVIKQIVLYEAWRS